MLRPSMSRGRPALGCADSFAWSWRGPSARSFRASAPDLRCSSRRSRSRREPIERGTNSSGGMPSRLSPSSSVVICATIGRSDSDRTAAIAAPSSLTSRNVSRMKRSTPPSASAAACARNSAVASSTLVLPARLDADPQRPNRPGHPRRVLAAAPGQTRAGDVDLVQLVAPCRTLRASRALAPNVLRLDDVGARRGGTRDELRRRGPAGPGSARRTSG